MRKIIFALWTLLAFYGFNLNAKDKTIITYSGSACPPGSIIFENDENGLPVSARFTNFFLHVLPQSSLHTVCSFALPIKGQAGMQATISTIALYGSHTLPLNAWGQVYLEAFFTGTREPVISQNYLGTANFYSTFEPEAWSPCGKDTIARVHLSMNVRNQSSNMATMQIAAIGTRPLPFFKINWRSCNRARV